MTRITEMYYLPLQKIKSNLLLHTSLIVMVVPDFIKETNSQPKLKNGHLMFYTLNAFCITQIQLKIYTKCLYTTRSLLG